MKRGSTRYSFSRVSTFEQCARRFRYRYLDGVKEAFQGVEAFMGRQVHATVEWLFNQRDEGHLPALQEAVAYYCDVWDRETASSHVRIRVIKTGDALLDYHRRGADMVASFYNDRFVGDELETVANEKHFLIRVGASRVGASRAGESYLLQGFIDRLARDVNGVFHVIDYKTGKQRTKSFVGKDAEQLRTYSLAIFDETDAEEVHLHLEYLSTGCTLSSRIGRVDATQVEARLVAKIESLEASTVYPPTPGILCRWCGYNDICDASGMGPQALPMAGLQ